MGKTTRLLLLFWLPVVLWMGFIFRCSAVPGSDIPSLFPNEDIVFHAGVYAFLAWLFSRALTRTNNTVAPTLIGWAILFCLLYGISDELHQLFVPNRTCDMFDVYVDAAGATLGSILYYLWLRLNLLRR